METEYSKELLEHVATLTDYQLQEALHNSETLDAICGNDTASLSPAEHAKMLKSEHSPATEITAAQAEYIQTPPKGDGW